MIKVCHMTSVHTRYDVRIFQKECTSLAEAGFQVYLVVDDEAEDEVKNGVHIKSTLHKPKNRIGRMFNSAKKVYRKALDINAEVYHFHDPELLFYGYLFKKRKKKVIFDSHEITVKQIETKDYLPLFPRKIIAFFYKIYERSIVKKLDAVIIPSTYNGKRYFSEQCKRNILIDNVPIADEVYIDLSTYERKKCQACYIGSLTAERGIPEISSAAEKAGIPLVLAGAFSSSELKNSLFSNKNPFLEYRGVLDRIQIKELLRECYMGMSVLQDVGQYRCPDNLPTKVYEYMGAGLPVIVSDFPYYKKVIEEYRCGICVHPDCIEEIAESMKWLWEHPKEAKEMGKRGQKAVKEKFNWALEKQKLISLYKDLLGMKIH